MQLCRRLKLSKLFELPPPAIWFAAPSRNASAVSARGTSRRMVHARTRCPARALLISRECQSQENGSSRIRITQNDEESFDCDCRARVLGGSGRCWRYRRGRKNVQEMSTLPYHRRNRQKLDRP